MRAAVAVSLVALSCASRPPCAAGRVCGAATWATGPATDDRLVLLSTIDVGVPDESPGVRESIPLRRGSAFLRFDLSSVPRGARVSRALLALSPHPTFTPSPSAARLRVRLVADGWSSESVARGDLPSTRDDRGAELTLPAGQRSGARVDVTAAVRAWVDGSAASEGLALECDHRGAAFVGAGALATSLRPRIELEVR